MRHTMWVNVYNRHEGTAEVGIPWASRADAVGASRCDNPVVRLRVTPKPGFVWEGDYWDIVPVPR